MEVAKKYVTENWGEYPNQEWDKSEGYNCYMAGYNKAMIEFANQSKPDIELIAQIKILENEIRLLKAQLSIKSNSGVAIAFAEKLKKIKIQFDLRKEEHLENQKHQPEMLRSLWSAQNTANLIEVLYKTVEEILTN